MRRKVFYIDVADMKPEEVMAYLNKVREQLKEEKKRGYSE